MTPKFTGCAPRPEALEHPPQLQLRPQDLRLRPRARPRFVTESPKPETQNGPESEFEPENPKHQIFGLARALGFNLTS